MLLYLLQRGVGVGAGDAVEYRHDAREQLAGPLHRDDGVFEVGWRGIVGDGFDFVDLLRHARFDGRLVVVSLILSKGGA